MDSLIFCIMEPGDHSVTTGEPWLDGPKVSGLCVGQRDV